MVFVWICVILRYSHFSVSMCTTTKKTNFFSSKLYTNFIWGKIFLINFKYSIAVTVWNEMTENYGNINVLIMSFLPSQLQQSYSLRYKKCQMFVFRIAGLWKIERFSTVHCIYNNCYWKILSFQYNQESIQWHDIIITRRKLKYFGCKRTILFDKLFEMILLLLLMNI